MSGDELPRKIEDARAEAAIPDLQPGERAFRLGRLASLLHDLYERTHEKRHLQEALDLFREAIELIPDPSPSHANLLGNYGVALHDWHIRSGSRTALERAIEIDREALALTADDAAERPDRLTNLAVDNAALFLLTRDEQALQRAIELETEALSIAPDDERQTARKANLAANLFELFLVNGNRDDLSRAIELTDEAREATPESDADYPFLLNNLASLLRARARLAASRPDLENAVRLGREALKHLPPGTPDREIALGDLSMSLSDWYDLSRDQATLREAIALGREALRTSDPSSVDHATLTAALAVDIYELFRRTDDAGLLSEAIALDRQALALTPLEHTNRPRWLNNLSIALRRSHTLSGDRGALDEALAAAREAVELTPDQSPDRPPRLATLSAALEDIFRTTDEPAARDAAITAAGEAAQGATEWAAARRARRSLARLLIERDGEGDLDAAAAQLRAAVDDAAGGLDVQRGEEAAFDYLRGSERVFTLAVSCFVELARRLDAADPADAVTWLEQAWLAAEQAKGRLLASLLVRERSVLATPELEPLLAQIAIASERLAVLETQLDRDDSDDIRPGARHAAMQELRATRQHLGKLRDELRRRDPQLASLTGLAPRPLTEIQSELDINQYLLYLYPTPTQLIAFALTRDTVAVATSDLTRATLREWTAQLEDATRRTEDAADGDIDSLVAALSDAISPTVEALLKRVEAPMAMLAADADAPVLVLVPTWALHRWPLHMLRHGSGMLIDSFATVYAPTADTFLYCHRRTPTVGQPTLFAPEPRLGGCYLEAALAETMGWRTILGAEVTLDSLAASSGALAIASHAAQVTPHNCLLQLGHGEASEIELLRALRTRRDANSVSLAVCAAHPQAPREGDHLQGLTGAFLALGFRSLTTTLWPANDATACFLGTRTRELTSRGRSYEQALRQATLELRDTDWSALAAWFVSAADRLADPAASALCHGYAVLCHAEAGTLSDAGPTLAAFREHRSTATACTRYQPALTAFTERYAHITALAEIGVEHIHIDRDTPRQRSPLEWAGAIHVGAPTGTAIGKASRTGT